MRKDKLSKQNVILYFLGIIPVVWLGLLIAPCLEDGLIGLVQQFGTIMQNPFRIELCEDSVKAVLVLLLAYGIAIGVYLSSEHNYRRREEHGSAKWGTAGSVNKKYANKDKTENKILTQNGAIGLDGRKHRRNLNVLVCGGSGAGKTRFFAKPNIMNANTSFVVLDPKGELLRDTGHLLKEHGYDIKVLDLINMEKSHCYNPFVYLQSDDDIQRLTTNLFKNTTPKGSQTQDPFWDQTAAMLLKALVCYLHYEAPPDEQNFPMVMEMKRMAPGCTNTVEYEIYGLDGSAKFSTEDANAVWYTRNQGREQAWSRLMLGQRTLFPVITGGIFEFGFSDAMLQMFAAFIAELCGEPCAFGCFRPDEALLSHQLLTGALRAYETGSVVRLD